MGLGVVRKVENAGFEPTIEGNGSYALTWDGAGHLIQIDKTVGAFTYRRILTWSGDDLVAISEWVKL